MKFITKKESDLSVLGRIAASWGLLLIMVVAPLCWGLLPIGYGILNANAEIKANPYFTVFMRMLTSFGLTALVAICIWLWFGVLDRNQARRAGFRALCCQTRAAIKSRLVWLVLLFVFYFGARALEMKSILTYSLDRGEFAANVSKIQKGNAYLGEVSPPVEASEKWAVEERTVGALKDYGYFMGLMLALLLAVKNNALYGTLSKTFRCRAPGFAENLGRLRGGKMNFVGKLFWVGTLFLTIASGILYIAAKEPLYVWPYVASMTGIACFVALLTSFGTDCKILGNVAVDKPVEGCPSWVAALVASVTVNLFQAGGTALIALVAWSLTRSSGMGFGTLFGQYLSGWNAVALVVLIGLLGSVVAPISQLFGVNLHDAKLKRIGMTGYGVTGGNWLMICGGFEPLFVVLIGLAVPMAGGSLVSLCPMLIAVATVMVIALLKIAEVWSEKNSVVRNAIFTKVRGSTQDTHASMTDAELRERAVQLSYLKFYDKRRELSAYATSLTKPMPLDGCDLPINQKIPTAYLAFLVNGQHYFTQDDPFTNTVLGAHELYLTRLFPDVEVISLKRFLVNGGRISAEDWRAKVRPSARKLATESGIVGDDAMPYVIISTDKGRAMACASEWSVLLQDIGKAVQSGELDSYVNGMIVQFEDKP